MRAVTLLSVDLMDGWMNGTGDVNWPGQRLDWNWDWMGLMD